MGCLKIIYSSKYGALEEAPIFHLPQIEKQSPASKNRVNCSAFGVELTGRNFTASGAEEFRYGFQGQEEDDEIKGEGNSLNYTYRMHDPRLGRFFAIDPLAPKYPFYSPYAFSGNRVIDSKELEGLEPCDYRNTQTGEISTFDDYYGESFKDIVGITIYGENYHDRSLAGTTQVDEVEYEFVSQALPKPVTVANDIISEVSDRVGEKLEGARMGSNGKLYAKTKSGGVFKGNQYCSTELVPDGISKNLKKIGTIGKVIDIYNTYKEFDEAIMKDGGTIGRNTIQKGCEEGGSWAGTAAGAEMGGLACAPLGPVGIAFGAAAGAIIGGIMGEEAVKTMFEKPADNPIYSGPMPEEWYQQKDNTVVVPLANY